jgi:uncharacterized membrane protein YhiD involved in acid resistance
MSVSGLTTAASIWKASAIGMPLGVAFYAATRARTVRVILSSINFAVVCEAQKF